MGDASQSDKICFYGRIKRFWNIENEKPNSRRWLKRLFVLEGSTLRAYNVNFAANAGPKDDASRRLRRTISSIQELNEEALGSQLTLSWELRNIKVPTDSELRKCVKKSDACHGTTKRRKEYTACGFPIEG